MPPNLVTDNHNVEVGEIAIVFQLRLLGFERYGIFSHDSRSGLVHLLGVFERNVCAKHFVEHFSGFRSSTL